MGIDIGPQCMAFNNSEQNIFVEIGDQSDATFLRLIVEKYGPFDVIIDDRSHIASHQIASFNAPFLAGLKEKGVYLVEDLECMY